jgi:hypothetical protein
LFIETKVEGITVSHIDEKSVLAAYQKNVLDKARETINGGGVGSLPALWRCCLQW